MDAAQVVAIFLGIWWVVAAWILTFYWSDGNHLSVSPIWKQTSNGCRRRFPRLSPTLLREALAREHVRVCLCGCVRVRARACVVSLWVGGLRAVRMRN